MNGIPVPTGVDSTPINYRVLGISPADNPEGFTNTHATMGVYILNSGGAVFNTGTINWANGLSTDPVVQKITKNVFTQFEKGTFPPEILSYSPYVTKNKNINNENITFNSRDSIVITSDSLKFEIHAVNPENGELSYFWKVNNNLYQSDSIFYLQNNLVNGYAKVTGFVYNSTDTASINWNVYNNQPLLPASIGDKVWIDSNRNGIQDAGEQGLQWVTVDLLKCDGTWLNYTLTDQNGNYSFTDLQPGDYYLKFYLIDANSIYKFTIENAGNNDSLDSDVNPVDSLTECVTLTSGENNFTVDAGVYDFTTDVKENQNIPKDFSLKQNYPNPFNPSTKIEFTVPKSEFLTLDIYNVLGQKVATLINNEINPGYHSVIFNAEKLSSGIYFYRLYGENVNMIKKMILQK